MYLWQQQQMSIKAVVKQFTTLYYCFTTALLDTLVHTKDLGITWSIFQQDKESGFANVLFAAVDASFADLEKQAAVNRDSILSRK